MKLVANLGEVEAEVMGSIPTAWGEADVFEDGRDRYLSFPSVGVSVMFREGRLDSVFLYGEGVDGFSGYAGEIPFGLTFGDSEEVVVSRLERDPASEGVIRAPPFPKRSGSSWARFRLPTYALHVEFSDASRRAIRLITLMQRDSSEE
jgi:hypothetical protein